MITYQNIQKNDLFLHFYSVNEHDYVKLSNFGTDGTQKESVCM